MASRILPSFAQQAEIEAVMRNGWISSCPPRVVGRKPARKTFRVLEQHVAHAIDAFE